MYTLPNQNNTTLAKKSNPTLIPGHIIKEAILDNLNTIKETRAETTIIDSQSYNTKIPNDT